MILFRRMVVFLNRRCTAACPHCNAAATPDCGEEWSPRELSSFFHRSRIVLPRYVTWTGGEPFLSPHALREGLAAVHRYSGFSEILTGGAWFDGGREFLRDLRKTTDFTLRISVDSAHRSAVSLKKVEALVRACREEGIDTAFTLRDTGESGKLEATRALLSGWMGGKREDPRRFHVMPHFPLAPSSSRARPEVQGEEWRKPCPQLLHDLVIGNDGWIYPCCGIFQKPDYRNWALGKAETLSETDLLHHLETHPFLKVLNEKGPAGFLEPSGRSPEDLCWDRIRYPCDVCFALWYEEKSALS